MTLRRYHDLLRALVTPHPSAAPRAPRLGDPTTYADLVRLQHRQPLAEVFRALRVRLGDARFDALVESFRARCPPCDPHPARWMRSFADHVAEHGDLDLACAELADLDATRIELSRSSLSGPFGADGALRAYQHDPRRGDGAEARCTLLIARTRDGTLRVIEVDAEMIAAWGLLQGEVSREALAARGLDEARIARGSAALKRSLM